MYGAAWEQLQWYYWHRHFAIHQNEGCCDFSPLLMSTKCLISWAVRTAGTEPVQPYSSEITSFVLLP